MATESYIQNLIDTNLANDSDILPEEHREVEDALLGEFFPDSLTVIWDGDTQESGLPNVECNTSLTTIAKCTFTIYLTKHGNRVFYKGALSSTETIITTGNFTMATFPTTLYKPLPNHQSLTNIINLTLINPSTSVNTAISVSENGIKLLGTITSNTSWQFEGSYKVAN